MARDYYLLSVEANERSLTHRLAIYIEQEFPDYNVDCEFQKDGMDTKKLARFSNPAAKQAGTVYPDIIVHHRGTDDNFIVIESKPSSKDDPCKKSPACDCDCCKLWAYREELKYKHAFYIVFPFPPDEKLKNYSMGQIDNYVMKIVKNPTEPVVVAQ